MADDSAEQQPATRSARLIGFAVLGALGLYGLYVALSLGLWRGRSPGEAAVSAVCGLTVSRCCSGTHLRRLRLSCSSSSAWRRIPTHRSKSS